MDSISFGIPSLDSPTPSPEFPPGILSPVMWEMAALSRAGGGGGGL